MRRSLLLLVRWHGDVIAAHTVEEGSRGERPELADAAGYEGVTVEVVDVSRERASLPRGGSVDLRAALSYVGSAAIHVAVAAMVLLSIRGRSPQQLEAEDANRRASMVHEYLTKIAANDSGSERPNDNGRHSASVVETAEPPPAAPLPPPSAARPPEPRIESGRGPKQVVIGALPTKSHGASPTPGAGGTDNITTSNAVCAPPKATAASGPMCTRSVVVTSLNVPPGCWTDSVVKVGQTGTLTYPCEGDGAATLAVGSKSFAGSDISGKVDVCTGTEFPWSDGCQWTSAQRVSGNITSGTLQFSYGEAPKPGSGHSCAPSCSASGVVRIEASPAKPPDGRRAEK